MTARSATALAIVTSAALLGGCMRAAIEQTAETAIEKQMGGNADVDINTDGSVRVENEEGTFEIGGGDVPADWPSDVPVYGNATVTFSGTSNPITGTPGLALSLTTTDTSDDVLDYYEKNLGQNGWSVQNIMRNPGANIVSASKDTRMISMLVVSAEGTTAITISIEESKP